MPACLNCSAQLNEFPTPTGTSFVCPSCSGRALGIDLVKHRVGREFLTLLGQRVLKGRSGRERACPQCAAAMQMVYLANMDPAVTIDICADCQLIWFDPDEYEMVHMTARGERGPGAARKDGDSILPLCRPDHFMQWIPVALGMPIELGGSRRVRQPWVTWGLSATLVFIFTLLAVSGNVYRAIQDLGFVPNQWARHVGVTLLTSFFVHAGGLHLLGNVYCLLVFGDSVEDRLGSMWFVGLLAVSHLAGIMLEGMFSGARHLPCVGASAGILGVMACYAVLFPKAKLGILPIPGLVLVIGFRLIRMPAIVYVAVWCVGIQAIGAISAGAGSGGIAYLAHLGGLILGALAGVIAAKRSKIALKE